MRGQAIPRGPADPVARFLFCHHELARSEREICISTNAPPRNHRPFGNAHSAYCVLPVVITENGALPAGLLEPAEVSAPVLVLIVKVETSSEMKFAT